MENVNKFASFHKETICNILHGCDLKYFSKFQKRHLQVILEKFELKSPKSLKKSQFIEEIRKCVNHERNFHVDLQ